MSKPGKVLKGLCKKLGIRLTVKSGKKRVYKSVKVLKAQCKRKQKKKKKSKVKRKRRFGKTPFIVPGKKIYDNLDDFIKIRIDNLYYQLEQLVKQDNFTGEKCGKLHNIIEAIETFDHSLVPDIAYTTWNVNCSYI